ncbi:zinc finger protein 184-like [Anopheles marshallii]|uniref:zinc finger protein 184-like n=1 Tax=Anopheles marshallii TaxID=1521116 RepID=UPI00237A2CDA|nr:zinc finger protein 184-like [Anopheles marshallii]
MEPSCRLCTNTDQTLTSIADYRIPAVERQAAAVTLDHLIEQYLAISVNPSTYDPLICANCLQRIEEWHAFRESCQQHDRLFQEKKISLDQVVKTEPPCELYITGYGTKSDKRSNDTEATQLEEDFDEDVIQLPSETESSNHVSNASPSPVMQSEQNDPSSRVSRRTRQEGRRLQVTKRKRGRPKKLKENSERLTPIKFADQPVRKQRPIPKICSICGVARTDMAAHMRWHNNERPYQCPHCPKIFLNSSNLKNHINLHTREKMYKCDLCDKEFPSSTGRSKHRETHTTERSHLCNVCDKSFKYRASLARHKLIHFEEPKEKCSVCDMLFLTKTRLTKHFLVHMNVKPFSCEVCGKAFNRKDNLKTHKKTHITGRRSEKKREMEEGLEKIDLISKRDRMKD